MPAATTTSSGSGPNARGSLRRAKTARTPHAPAWPRRAAPLAAARPSRDAQRARLQDYIARNAARASTAKQAQSRAKMLAKMQPIAALADDPSLSFDFPSPSELKPPLITLEMAAVGYAEGAPVLS